MRANDERTQDQTQPADDGAPTPEPTSYTMLDPRFREIYFRFYKETYKPSVLDRRTKELVAIAVRPVEGPAHRKLVFVMAPCPLTTLQLRNTTV